MGLFPLEDVRTMVFELSLIRSAPWAGVLFSINARALGGLAFVRGLSQDLIYTIIYIKS